MSLLVTLLVVYCSSVLFIFLFYRLYNPNGGYNKAGDLAVVLVPVFNTVMILPAITVMLMSIDWDKVAKKVLG